VVSKAKISARPGARAGKNELKKPFAISQTSYPFYACGCRRTGLS